MATNTFSDTVLLQDNVALQLGTDADAAITYDETTDDRVEVTGADWYMDLDLTVTGDVTATGDIHTFGSGTGTNTLAVNGNASNAAVIELQAGGVKRWSFRRTSGAPFALRAHDSGGTTIDDVLTVTNAAKGLFQISRHTEIQTVSDEAEPALLIDQNDTDEAFINFEGSSGTGVGQHITTWTSGQTIQGHIQVEINGTTRWIPFYDAPTS